MQASRWPAVKQSANRRFKAMHRAAQICATGSGLPPVGAFVTAPAGTPPYVPEFKAVQLGRVPQVLEKRRTNRCKTGQSPNWPLPKAHQRPRAAESGV